MKRLLWAGLLAVPLLLATTRPAVAQAPYPGCGPNGCPVNGGPGYGMPGYGVPGGPGCGPAAVGAYPTCGIPCSYAGCYGFCMNLFGKMHFHGPLFNYGPYYGYYPFEPYGPWTSDLRYNPPPAPCRHCGDGGHAWRLYSLLTFKNVVARHPPLGHKCGKGGWSNCTSGDCGSGCASAPGANVVSIPPAPATTVAAGTR